MFKSEREALQRKWADLPEWELWYMIENLMLFRAWGKINVVEDILAERGL